MQDMFQIMEDSFNLDSQENLSSKTQFQIALLDPFRQVFEKLEKYHPYMMKQYDIS